MLWFKDLTLSDPYFGLPIMCTLTTLAMVEYGMSMSGDQLAGTPEKEKQVGETITRERVGLECKGLRGGA